MVRGLTGIKPVQLTGFSLVLSSVVAIPLALVLEQPDPVSWSTDVWHFALAGLVSTAFAFSLRYVLINRAGAVLCQMLVYNPHGCCSDRACGVG